MLDKTILEFKNYLDKMQALNKAVGMFYWDMTTGGAPRGGLDSRSKVIGLLSAEAFSMVISDEMKGFLEILGENFDKLDTITAGMYTESKKSYDKLAKIPVDEYREFSELCATSSAIWEEAKEKSEFELFLPYLEKLIAITKRFIDYRGYKDHPYNTLLDDYEPGMTVAKLDDFFSQLKTAIVPLLKKVQSSAKNIRTDFISKTVPHATQKELTDMLISKIGYNLDRGLVKESAHPFTTSFGQTDVRITTHIYENNFLSSYYSVMHECGHAIYEQNVAPELNDTILDGGVSLGIHESQSRFYENVLGRSMSFWKLIYDDVKRILPDEFNDVTINEFFEASNLVEPSLIRTDADELTYSLHIMIRYEIEKMLFDGSVNAKDLPKIWNEKVKEYLGIDTPNDAKGVLQDVHWSEAMFGYFPSYALGNAYSAQILNKMKNDFDIFGAVESGDFEKIRLWLAENIHKYGMTRTPGEIIKAISGEELTPKYYIDYLVEKYSQIYELS